MITQDFLSSQATQSYPFVDAAYSQAKTNEFLPKYLILDLRLNLPPGAPAFQDDQYPFYLHSIQDTGATLNFYVGYTGDNKQYKCGGFYGVQKTLSMSGGIAQRTFVLNPISTGEQQVDAWMIKMSGTIVVGQTYKYTGNSVQFTPDQTQIDKQCVNKYLVSGVQSISVGDVTLTGDVELTSDGSIDISVEGQTITFAVNPEYISELGKTALQLITSNYGVPIASINGVYPNAEGNINLQGLDCVSVTTAGVGTIKISNPCAKPCCTGTQNQNINAMVKVIQQAQNVLRSYFVNQMNTINYMQANLATLMSK